MTKQIVVTYHNNDDRSQAQGTISANMVNPTDQAVPTGRLLDGSCDHGYVEEWQEPAILPDGRECYRIYLFAAEDIYTDDGYPIDADEYPWDDDHVARIILI